MRRLFKYRGKYHNKYRMTLSAVHMVYRLVNSTYDPKELLLRLTRLVCQLIQASSACVYMLDPSKKRIKSIAAFRNNINIWIDKKSEISKVPPEEKAVTVGNSIVTKHMIGLPLVADDNIGAIFIRRKSNEKPFNEFDKELLSVVAEQSVTAIRNLQLSEEQQEIILSSIKTIGKMLQKQSHVSSVHDPAYLKIIKCLAEKLNMGQSQIQCLHYASMLHDAGSIDVPFEILSKTSRLTPEEFKLIRDIPTKSAEIIEPVEFLKPVLPIILYHREKYDGTGYPSGLKKEQIPIGARVMAVVNAFEAMLRPRSYKRRLSITEAIEELKRNSGTQFDPKVVKAFCELSKQKKFRKYLSSLEK